MLKLFNVKFCLVLGGSICILLIGLDLLIFSGIREVHRVQNTVNCVNNMYGIALSVQDYEYSKDNPKSQIKLPFYGNDETREEYWSWRASYITHFAPYVHTNRFCFSEPWNSEYNFPLFKKTDIARVFSCPCEQQTEKASYVAVTGSGTFWTEMQYGNLPGQFSDYKEMIFIIETSEPKNFWAQPGDDITPDEVIRLFKSDPGLVKNSKQHSKKDYTHWPKHYVTVIGEVKKFDSIKNTNELWSLLIISPEQIEKARKKVEEREVFLSAFPLTENYCDW